MLISEMTLSIAGSAKRMVEDSLRVSYQANGRATLGVAVVSDDGSYVPAMDAEVLLTDPVSGSQFGGYIATPSVAGVFSEPLAPITTTIDVDGYASLAERRYVNEVIPPGTLKAALQRIVPYLASAGVTLDGAQVNGPSLGSLVYDYVQLKDVLNDLARLSGYVWDFTGLVVRMYAPGAIAAPFNIVDGNGKAVGDITVTSSRHSQVPYANRIIARSSTAVNTIYGETHPGDGSTRVFQLSYVAVELALPFTTPILIVSNSIANPTVVTSQIPHELTTGQSVDIADVSGSSPTINGTRTVTVIDGYRFSVPVNVTTGGTGGTWVRTNAQGGSVRVHGAGGVEIGVFAVGVYGVDDMPWTFEAATNSLHQRADQTVLPSDGYVLLSYSVRMTAYADDAAQQAAHGTWEAVAVVDTPFVLTLIDFANAYLAAHKATPRTVTYRTYDPGLRPGQTQTISIASRGLNESYLIIDVQLGTEGDRVVWTVTAIEGSVYQGSWQDTYTQWSRGTSVMAAGAAIGPGGVSGTPGSVVSSGGTTWLGGSSAVMVESSAPDWVPVDGTAADPGLDVTLNTATRGTLAAVVTARLRATAGTVQARLRNITDGVTVGLSSVVSSATFQTVQFPATLTTGEKRYRLEVLPSLAATPVNGMGYLE